MKFIPFLFLCLMTIPLFSQAESALYMVSGKVQDSETHLPLQFVTISFQDKNSGEVVGDISDKEGLFELSVPEGNYYCIVESLSFQPFVIDQLQVNMDLDMGVIELEQHIENLEEVEIIAKANLVDHQFTKKIYNASKDIANIGGNAVTVLENTPSVRIDDTGNISIRGNPAQVLVDGKPYGGQSSNADVLSLIPSNSISKVEIISQSAKYDAQGGGGIINIILKKRTNEGYNGTVEGHLGQPANHGVSGFLNYKTENINIFSTASFNHLTKIKKTEIEQVFLDDSQLAIGNFDQQRYDHRHRDGFLFNIGSDFYIDDKNTLTTSLLYSVAGKSYESELELNDYRPVDELIRTANRLVDDDSNQNYLEVFLSYSTQFDEDGHQLSMDLKYDNSNADNDTDVEEEEIFPDNLLRNQQYTKNESLNNFYIKFDYTLPIKENGQFEAGLKSNFREYKNDFSSFNLDLQTGVLTIIPDFTSKITYDERIHAAYANYSHEYGQWAFAVGLRSELTYTTIKEENIDTSYDNDYHDLFPKLSASYSMNRENSLTFGYTRYIDRPTVAQLNPFNSFADERFILVGNPFLQPYYTNYTYLEYYQEFSKLTMNLAVFYSNSTERIMDVLEKTGNQTVDGFDIYRRNPINNGTLNYTGGEVELTYNPNNKIRLYALVSPYHADLKDTRDNAYDYQNWVWYGNFRFLYRFTDTFRANLDYTYQSEQRTAITSLKDFQYVNLNISKDFLEGKATLSLKINDLFYTRKSDFNSLEANTISHRTFIFDTQYLLSFSYRFNKASRRNAHNRSKDTDKNIFEIDDQVK